MVRREGSSPAQASTSTSNGAEQHVDEDKRKLRDVMLARSARRRMPEQHVSSDRGGLPRSMAPTIEGQGAAGLHSPTSCFRLRRQGGRRNAWPSREDATGLRPATANRPCERRHQNRATIPASRVVNSSRERGDWARNGSISATSPDVVQDNQGVLFLEAAPVALWHWTRFGGAGSPRSARRTSSARVQIQCVR